MTTPLAIFLEIWSERIPADVLPYVEAVNYGVDTNDAHDPWGAAIVQPEARADVTLGTKPWVEENGTIPDRAVHALGLRPGRARRGGRVHPADLYGARRDGLVIQQVDGPHDVDPEGFGEWWQLALTARTRSRAGAMAPTRSMAGWEGFPAAPPPPCQARDLPTRFEVTGLRQAKANFQELYGQVQRDIGRQALRAARRHGRADRPRPTPLQRRTGAIRAGLVGVQPSRERQSSTRLVEEYAQSIAGPASAFASLVRVRRAASADARRRPRPSPSGGASWSSAPGRDARAAARVPAQPQDRHSSKGRPVSSSRSAPGSRPPTAAASPPGRGCVRRSASNAPQAIQAFRDTMLKLIDAAVSAMPK